MEAFNKEFTKQFFKSRDAQDLQDPEKLLEIFIKYMNSNENKINNTKQSMTGMKPKDTILTTDFILSKITYWLDQIAEERCNNIFYYLQDGPDRAFVREKWMHIPENTQVPLEWVSKWK